MLNVKYKLREPKSKRLTSITLFFYYDNKRFVASTRRKIHPKDWDFNRERPKRSYPAYSSLTAYLDRLQIAINDRYNNLVAFGQYPTNEDFKDAILNASGKLNAERPTLIDRLKEEAQKEAGIKKMNNRLLTLVRQFSKQNRKPTNIEAINGQWYIDFQTWLIANKSESYAYRMAKQLRTVVRRTNFDWSGKNEVLNSKLKAKEAYSEKISLSFDDLAHLKQSIPSLSEEQARTAKILYLACVTGLRRSDWHKLTLDGNIIDVEGWRFAKVVMQKTSKLSGIKVAYPPLLDITKRYLTELDGGFAWQSKFNIQAKEMGQAAGFDRPVRLMSSRKGETVENEYQMFEQFTSKIGRNSFTSNFRALGIPDNLLNVMTGHTGKKSMADVYDTRKFEQIAVQIIPYLQRFDEELSGGSYLSEHEMRFV